MKRKQNLLGIHLVRHTILFSCFQGLVTLPTISQSFVKTFFETSQVFLCALWSNLSKDLGPLLTRLICYTSQGFVGRSCNNSSQCLSASLSTHYHYKKALGTLFSEFHGHSSKSFVNTFFETSQGFSATLLKAWWLLLPMFYIWSNLSKDLWPFFTRFVCYSSQGFVDRSFKKSSKSFTKRPPFLKFSGHSSQSVANKFVEISQGLAATLLKALWLLFLILYGQLFLRIWDHSSQGSAAAETLFKV